MITQGYDVPPATVYQDNMSTIAILKKGKMTNNSNTRHINIRYFFARDKVIANKMEIKYKNSEEMTADIFTKPLQGQRFLILRKIIMNFECPCILY